MSSESDPPDDPAPPAPGRARSMGLGPVYVPRLGVEGYTRKDPRLYEATLQVQCETEQRRARNVRDAAAMRQSAYLQRSAEAADLALQEEIKRDVWAREVATHRRQELERRQERERAEEEENIVREQDEIAQTSNKRVREYRHLQQKYDKKAERWGNTGEALNHGITSMVMQFGTQPRTNIVISPGTSHGSGAGDQAAAFSPISADNYENNSFSSSSSSGWEDKRIRLQENHNNYPSTSSPFLPQPPRPALGTTGSSRGRSLLQGNNPFATMRMNRSGPEQQEQQQPELLTSSSSSATSHDSGSSSSSSRAAPAATAGLNARALASLTGHVQKQYEEEFVNNRSNSNLVDIGQADQEAGSAESLFAANEGEQNNKSTRSTRRLEEEACVDDFQQKKSVSSVYPPHENRTTGSTTSHHAHAPDVNKNQRVLYHAAPISTTTLQNTTKALPPLQFNLGGRSFPNTSQHNKIIPTTSTGASSSSLPSAATSSAGRLSTGGGYLGFGTTAKLPLQQPAVFNPSGAGTSFKASTTIGTTTTTLNPIGSRIMNVFGGNQTTTSQPPNGPAAASSSGVHEEDELMPQADAGPAPVVVAARNVVFGAGIFNNSQSIGIGANNQGSSFNRAFAFGVNAAGQAQAASQPIATAGGSNIFSRNANSQQGLVHQHGQEQGQQQLQQQPS
ncbi:unnamed protein product [Amoebophrya sp. A120]|nr:unnamed protein product [Amoebophrya sp. A120]|eukprot:GSA120T00021231001.1